jgi:hypothetical protein
MNCAKHTHADHATVTAFWQVGWHSWKVASFRVALRAWSACCSVI